MANFEYAESGEGVVNIKVIGCGGGGCNAVNRMIRSGVQGVDFVAVNTDKPVLDASSAPTKLQIGEKLTKGKGAGSDPQIGENSALENREEIEEILKEFEMDDKQDKLGNELSKGMMQKVSICCALAVKPKVILLDEPMVGLDPAAIRMLKEVVLRLRDQGVTVLISTHMLEMVEELWDVMFVMEKGRIIGSYTKSDAEGRDLDDLFFAMTGGEKQ